MAAGREFKDEAKANLTSLLADFISELVILHGEGVSKSDIYRAVKTMQRFNTVPKEAESYIAAYEVTARGEGDRGEKLVHLCEQLLQANEARLKSLEKIYPELARKNYSQIQQLAVDFLNRFHDPIKKERATAVEACARYKWRAGDGRRLDREDKDLFNNSNAIEFYNKSLKYNYEKAPFEARRVFSRLGGDFTAEAKAAGCTDEFAKLFKENLKKDDYTSRKMGFCYVIDNVDFICRIAQLEMQYQNKLVKDKVFGKEEKVMPGAPGGLAFFDRKEEAKDEMKYPPEFIQLITDVFSSMPIKKIDSSVFTCEVKGAEAADLFAKLVKGLHTTYPDLSADVILTNTSIDMSPDGASGTIKVSTEPLLAAVNRTKLNLR